MWDIARFFLWLAFIAAVVVIGYWLINCACWDGYRTRTSDLCDASESELVRINPDRTTDWRVRLRC